MNAESKVRQRHHQKKKKKDNYWSISMKNINAKIFDKISANLIQQYIKRIIQPNQVEFTQGGKDGSIYGDQSLKHLTLTNSRIKRSISIDEEKAYDKIKHPFIKETFKNVV